jgi:hypothetical protein
MREALADDADSRRAAFRALLGDSKMRVLADPERTFRVEGVFRLPLEMRIARLPDGEAGRFTQEVAGVGTAPRYGRILEFDAPLVAA